MPSVWRWIARCRQPRRSIGGRAKRLPRRRSTRSSQIQVLQAPHIAEAAADRMTRMEEQMAALDAAARVSLRQLQSALPPSASAALAEATGALDRFNAINKELIVLSRRNTDVQSLAMSLGRKRQVTAECADQLRGLEEALAKHEFTATR